MHVTMQTIFALGFNSIHVLASTLFVTKLSFDGFFDLREAFPLEELSATAALSAEASGSERRTKQTDRRKRPSRSSLATIHKTAKRPLP